jgi:hypothetical protein
MILPTAPACPGVARMRPVSVSSTKPNILSRWNATQSKRASSSFPCAIALSSFRSIGLRLISGVCMGHRARQSNALGFLKPLFTQRPTPTSV